MHRNFEMSLGLNIITISNFILRSVENLNIHFFNEIFKQYRGNLIINRVTTFYTLQIVTTIKLFKVLHKMYLTREGYIVACTKSLAMNESA